MLVITELVKKDVVTLLHVQAHKIMTSLVSKC